MKRTIADLEYELIEKDKLIGKLAGKLKAARIAKRRGWFRFWS